MRPTSETIQDQLLVLRWRRDADRAALDELLRRWDRRLLYYIRRVVDDDQDAWDVLQQTLLQVVRKLHSLRDPARLPAWLYGVARNAAMAHRRTEWAAERHVNGEADVAALAGTEDPDDLDLRFDDAEIVHRALGELAPAHREILTLLFLKDLSVGEIAEVLNVAPGTVKSRAYYARRNLRQILERMGVNHA